MNGRGVRRAATAFFLLGGLGVLFLFGAPWLGLDDPGKVRHWLIAARGPWALPVAVAAFALLAFVGVPQVVLIGAAVIAFGPWLGALYSWIGTMVSALVGFGIGRLVRAGTLRDLSNPKLERFLQAVGRNGFLASLAVRLIPIAPFVLVNVAAALTPMRLVEFAAGAAIGIVPKIAVVALAGHSLLHGGLGAWLWLGAAIALWLAAAASARIWLRR